MDISTSGGAKLCLICKHTKPTVMFSTGENRCKPCNAIRAKTMRVKKAARKKALKAGPELIQLEAEIMAIYEKLNGKLELREQMLKKYQNMFNKS